MTYSTIPQKSRPTKKFCANGCRWMFPQALTTAIFWYMFRMEGNITGTTKERSCWDSSQTRMLHLSFGLAGVDLLWSPNCSLENMLSILTASIHVHYLRCWAQYSGRAWVLVDWRHLRETMITCHPTGPFDIDSRASASRDSKEHVVVSE